MEKLDYDPDRKWLIEVTEKQLYDIINCVEDIHRFLGGDMHLANATAYIADASDMHEFHRQIDKLKHLVTPGLDNAAFYGWSGSGCPDKHQKAIIQRTYAIYRNLLHCIEKYRQRDDWNVYQRETLTCGVPLAVCYPKEEIKEKGDLKQ